MVRALAPTFLGVILGQEPAPLGPIVEARPVLVAAIHGQERHATTRADAVPEAAIEAMARDASLPAPGRVGLLLLVARGEKGLAPPRRQAQADGHVVHTSMPFGAVGPVLEGLIIQVGHEPLERPVEAKARVAPRKNTGPPVAIKDVGPKRLIAVLVPERPEEGLPPLALSARLEPPPILEVAKAR